MSIISDNINWNLPEPIIDKAFQGAVEDFAEQQKIEIQKEQWDWDRLTVRKVGRGVTGKYAGFIRDKVDTGELLDSQVVVFVDKHFALILFLANHAAIVHNGARFEDGRVYPASPFVWVALKNLPPHKVFAALLSVSL